LADFFVADLVGGADFVPRSIRGIPSAAFSAASRRLSASLAEKSPGFFAGRAFAIGHRCDMKNPPGHDQLSGGIRAGTLKRF